MRNELLVLICSRRFWHGSIPWVCLLLALCNWKVGQWKETLTDKRRQNLLAAAAPAADVAVNRAADIRYDRSCGELLCEYWPHVPDATRQRLVVLCGMSQMYAINQEKPGDKTISEWMDDALAPQGVRVFGLAAPNLSNEEALFLLLAGLENPQTTPHSFIFGACFDKFRNVDLRPGYQMFLQAHPGLQTLWNNVLRRYATRYPLATEKMQASLQSLWAAEGAAEGTFESRLKSSLVPWVSIIAVRKELNVQVQLALYDLRNWALGITPTSKRPVIPARYRMNQEFLCMMIDLAREHSLQFITYVIPLNNLAETPYIASQYEDFKQWLANTARQQGIASANLEDIVSTEDWGTLNGSPDFKHFRGDGHRRTSQALLEHFGPLLTRNTRDRKSQ